MVVQGGYIPSPLGLYDRLVEENKQRFTKEEVCFTDECMKREMVHRARGKGDFSFNILYYYDEDGFSYCSYCLRVSAKSFNQILVNCPDCGCFFKGPRRDFPIDYECENCG